MANSMPPKLRLFSLEIPELGLDRRIKLGNYENAWAGFERLKSAQLTAYTH